MLDSVVQVSCKAEYTGTLHELFAAGGVAVAAGAVMAGHLALFSIAGRPSGLGRGVMCSAVQDGYGPCEGPAFMSHMVPVATPPTSPPFSPSSLCDVCSPDGHDSAAAPCVHVKAGKACECGRARE